MLNMKKKILVLATGGTISSGFSPNNSLEPQMSIDSIMANLTDVGDNYAITTRDILMMDSSNIQPEEWQFIAREVFYRRKGFDGVVITHGTDTMAYTASMLTYMLKNIPVPVVLTGSQLPITHPLTDAYGNLRLALAMAASGLPGVFVAFHNKIILGCRAVKTRTMNFHAFESVNMPYIGSVDSSGLILNRELVPVPAGEPELLDRLSDDVFLIKLTPGLNPRIFDMLYDLEYQGIIIEAFGAGGLHCIHRDLVGQISSMVKKGVSVVACSQCLYERSDFSVYETGRLALDKGLIQAFDMTTEAAVTKLMWALGQSDDPAEIRRIFNTNIAGEISL